MKVKTKATSDKLEQIIDVIFNHESSSPRSSRELWDNEYWLTAASGSNPYDDILDHTIIITYTYRNKFMRLILLNVKLSFFIFSTLLLIACLYYKVRIVLYRVFAWSVLWNPLTYTNCPSASSFRLHLDSNKSLFLTVYLLFISHLFSIIILGVLITKKHAPYI